MSFELICSNCGASSGPSVGICPFCKSVMVDDRPGKASSPAYAKLVKLYNEGNLELAIFCVNEILKQEEKYAEDAKLMVLAAKILIETEGPNGRTRGLLGKALLVEPENTEVIDYLEIIQARFDLDAGAFEKGKENLIKLLQRSPENPHVLFLLGSSLFWKERNPQAAIPYLERCVRARPRYLRAWACLSGIAQELKNPQLAENALRRCIQIETNAKMKMYFEGLLAKLSVKKAA